MNESETSQNSNNPEVLKAQLWAETIGQLTEQYPHHNTSDEYNNILVEAVMEQLKDTARILEVLCHHRDDTMLQARDWDTLCLIRGIKQYTTAHVT
ncbi:hypothetical protein MOUN0_H01794 [Monosporozyma unispora]|nr:hypothetical protein C6P44_002759 [Kazachstania unispora]